MLYTFAVTFFIQILITEFAGAFFKTTPLGFTTWFNLTLISFSVIAITELYKLAYRIFLKNKKQKG